MRLSMRPRGEGPGGLAAVDCVPDESCKPDDDAGGLRCGGTGRPVRLDALGDGMVLGGLVPFVVGDALVVCAKVVSPWFEPMVRIQGERGHRVVSTWPYTNCEAPKISGGADLGFLHTHAAGFMVHLPRGGGVRCVDLVEDIPGGQDAHGGAA